MTEQLALSGFILFSFSLMPQLLRIVRDIRNEPPKSHGRLYNFVYSPGVAGFVLRPLAYLMTIFAPIVLLAAFVEQSLQLELNAMFTQQITVLDTKAAPQEIKQLRADWALMKTRNDFERIDAKINALARTYALTLPYTDSR